MPEYCRNSKMNTIIFESSMKVNLRFRQVEY